MSLSSLRDGLVLAICPSINGGGGIVPDLSSRNSPGVLTNMDASGYVSYSRGVALNFYRVNDYLTLPFFRGISDSFTISCWAYLRTIDSNVRPFLTAQVASYGNYWASFGTFQGRLSFGLFDGSNNPLTGDTGVGFAPNANQLYHFTAVRNVASDTIADYVNGVFNRSVTDTTTSIPTYGTLTIGGQTTPANRWVNGLLDDVRIYDRVLTPAEVALLATEPGIGLRPERSSVFFGAQLFQTAWLAQSRNIIGGGVC